MSSVKLDPYIFFEWGNFLLLPPRTCFLCPEHLHNISSVRSLDMVYVLLLVRLSCTYSDIWTLGPRWWCFWDAVVSSGDGALIDICYWRQALTIYSLCPPCLLIPACGWATISKVPFHAPCHLLLSLSTMINTNASETGSPNPLFLL